MAVPVTRHRSRHGGIDTLDGGAGIDRIDGGGSGNVCGMKSPGQQSSRRQVTGRIAATSPLPVARSVRVAITGSDGDDRLDAAGLTRPA